MGFRPGPIPSQGSHSFFPSYAFSVLSATMVLSFAASRTHAFVPTVTANLRPAFSISSRLSKPLKLKVQSNLCSAFRRSASLKSNRGACITRFSSESGTLPALNNLANTMMESSGGRRGLARLSDAASIREVREICAALEAGTLVREAKTVTVEKGAGSSSAQAGSEASPPGDCGCGPTQTLDELKASLKSDIDRVGGEIRKMKEGGQKDKVMVLAQANTVGMWRPLLRARASKRQRS